MVIRYRSKMFTGIMRYDKSGTFREYNYPLKEQFDDNIQGSPGPRPYYSCKHWKLNSPGKMRFNYPSNPRTYDPWVQPNALSVVKPWAHSAIHSVASENSFSLTELEFQRNNNFNIILALLEFDELLNMIVKPRSSFSYGGVKWGILPFVSDLKSLFNSFRDITSGIVGHGLSTGRRAVIAKQISKSWSHTYAPNVKLEGQLRLSARISEVSYPYSPELSSLLIFLDELGFHPDINTVWDGIPLSFLVDRFIPIGKTIDLLHPQGWFRPKVVATGGYTFKGTVSFDTTDLSSTYYVSDRITEYDVFIRMPLTVNSEQEPSTIKWNAPSLVDFFDLWYLRLK